MAKAAPRTLGLEEETPLADLLGLFSPAARVEIHELLDTLRPDAPILDDPSRVPCATVAELLALEPPLVGLVFLWATIDTLDVRLERDAWRITGERSRVLALAGRARALLPGRRAWLE